MALNLEHSRTVQGRQHGLESRSLLLGVGSSLPKPEQPIFMSGV